MLEQLSDVVIDRVKEGHIAHPERAEAALISALRHLQMILHRGRRPLEMGFQRQDKPKGKRTGTEQTLKARMAVKPGMGRRHSGSESTHTNGP